LGGEVALQTAIRHPDVVRKLVPVSTAYKRDGWYAESNAQDSSMNADTAKAMMQTPVYQFYAKVAPRPQDWPTIVTTATVTLLDPLVDYGMQLSSRNAVC
jgi:pimeloyl-ACP methyl ester carboxylesterase